MERQTALIVVLDGTADMTADDVAGQLGSLLGGAEIGATVYGPYALESVGQAALELSGGAADDSTGST